MNAIKLVGCKVNVSIIINQEWIYFKLVIPFKTNNLQIHHQLSNVMLFLNTERASKFKIIIVFSFIFSFVWFGFICFLMSRDLYIYICTIAQQLISLVRPFITSELKCTDPYLVTNVQTYGMKNSSGASSSTYRNLRSGNLRNLSLDH